MRAKRTKHHLFGIYILINNHRLVKIVLLLLCGWNTIHKWIQLIYDYFNMWSVFSARLICFMNNLRTDSEKCFPEILKVLYITAVCSLYPICVCVCPYIQQCVHTYHCRKWKMSVRTWPSCRAARMIYGWNNWDHCRHGNRIPEGGGEERGILCGGNGSMVWGGGPERVRVCARVCHNVTPSPVWVRHPWILIYMRHRIKDWFLLLHVVFTVTITSFI